MKAALVLATDDHPRTQTAGRLVRELRDVDAQVGAVSNAMQRRSTCIISPRATPNAVGDEDPGSVIAREDADIALARAERVLEFTRLRIARADSSR